MDNLIKQRRRIMKEGFKRKEYFCVILFYSRHADYIYPRSRILIYKALTILSSRLLGCADKI